MLPLEQRGGMIVIHVVLVLGQPETVRTIRCRYPTAYRMHRDGLGTVPTAPVVQVDLEKRIDLLPRKLDHQN